MEERKPKWLGANLVRSLETNLSGLESRLESLKIKYNQFFAGEIRTPPENEREFLENEIRRLLGKEQRSPRINLLVQNLAAKFTLFNNLWLKKLHDLETDIRPPGEITKTSGPPPPSPAAVQTLDISLNREESFDHFIDTYRKMLVDPQMSNGSREKLINSLKSKMISSNIVDARIQISREEGKLRIKLKK